ncbi:hypothetical protein [Halomonas sp. SL1]|uniref:hypothetical protein n=1 Tax=Halomonas sp. SL1 TaxID=2137478 RepID=UPI000D161CBC|nr:hypothetical protein [Halomonas sp. SL1]RAH37445.1 hypothetical protein C9J49_011120 [Halomonas sp. SL1]
MSPFYYCPTCWPADIGEYDTNHRCTTCRTRVLVANKDKQIELLVEQNVALSEYLAEAQEMLEQVLGKTETAQAKPRLRLVHSVRRKPS